MSALEINRHFQNVLEIPFIFPSDLNKYLVSWEKWSYVHLLWDVGVNVCVAVAFPQ